MNALQVRSTLGIYDSRETRAWTNQSLALNVIKTTNPEARALISISCLLLPPSFKSQRRQISHFHFRSDGETKTGEPQRTQATFAPRDHDRTSFQNAFSTPLSRPRHAQLGHFTRPSFRFFSPFPRRSVGRQQAPRQLARDRRVHWVEDTGFGSRVEGRLRR